MPSYLSSWAAELAAQSDRVRDLIGGAHWLSDGAHKEELIRSFLRNYVSSRLRVSQGFIKTVYPNERCSREIDVLIVDGEGQPSFFRSGAFEIVPPNSVAAFMQVKSGVSSAVMASALDNIATAASLAIDTPHPTRIWKGIAAYSHELACESVFRTVAGWINTFVTSDKRFEALGASASSEKALLLLPNCIAVLTSFVIFIQACEKPRSVRLKFVQAEALAAAYMFADLLAYSGVSGNSASQLDAIIESIRPPKPQFIDIDF
ncbi:DUF6602 domain-containing protein [Arenimonas sp.]|uniref:DUF6602 domain-containing protein n=1 Tax=Arenimonas sp. TaxID=1872635 RepID=UPI0039E36F20